MHRRSFIALAAVTPLAGCTGLLGGGESVTLEEEEYVPFEAEEDDELTISVDVQEGQETPDGEKQAGIRISHEAGEDWTHTEGVEGSESFDVTIEHGGEHRLMVTRGTAEVTFE